MIRRLLLFAFTLVGLWIASSTALAFVAIDPVALCNDSGGDVESVRVWLWPLYL